MPPDLQPCPRQLGFEFDPCVDAHMPPGHFVVLRGQGPADSFRQPAGHRDRRQPAGAQHPGELVYRPLVIEDVLEHLGRDHPVEAAVAERHRGGVAGNRRRGGRPVRLRLPPIRHRLRAGLARLPHRVEHPGHRNELGRVQVERDHVRAAPVYLERMPPATASHVEHAVARPDREPGEVNGQHAGSMTSRYWSAVARATADQANRSRARSSARSASAARSAGESWSRLSTAASSSSSPGVTRTAASPVTSGSAPVRLATSGVPDAICSTAGSENPSYSEGTTAISLLATSSARSESLMPVTNRTLSPSDSSPISCSVGPPDAGLPTTVSWTSRSVLILAKARSRVGMPFTGESALATAMMLPGIRGPGRGWNSRVSTPSGITRTLCSATPKSRTMSSREDCEPVITGPTRRATLACIRTKEYQRRFASRCSPAAWASSIRLSTLIGW